MFMISIKNEKLKMTFSFLKPLSRFALQFRFIVYGAPSKINSEYQQLDIYWHIYLY